MFYYIILFLGIVFAGKVFPAEDLIKNRVIYLIHGDGDYTFHENGETFLSDETVLQQALANAAKGLHSEYFIFHFKPKRTFLLFFPGEESEFYHYRNGQVVSEKKYFRFDPVDGHSAESFLLKESEPAKNVERNILLYYGHEIPIIEDYGYNASFPEVPVGLKSFKGRITDLLASLEKDKFDMLVLSTCNNGSPDFIFEMSEVADYIVASPGDLHLSQMNSAPLQMIETEEAPEINAMAFHFASAAFDILRVKTLTEVVISVYRTKDLPKKYNYEAICSSEGDMGHIVRVFFRPAKFGKNKSRISHSGWNCNAEKLLTTDGK